MAQNTHTSCDVTGKKSATILYCLHYLCILAIRWRLAVAVLGIIPPN